MNKHFDFSTFFEDKYSIVDDYHMFGGNASYSVFKVEIHPTANIQRVALDIFRREKGKAYVYHQIDRNKWEIRITRK